MPRRIAPITAGSRITRPAQSHAARPEPTATAIEHGEEDRHGILGTAQRVFHQRGQQRQDNRADAPEPAGGESAPPQTWLAPQIREQRPCRGEHVGGDLRSVVPEPTFGMNRLETSDSAARTTIRPAKLQGSPPLRAASPPTIVPNRMARRSRLPPTRWPWADASGREDRAGCRISADRTARR